MIQHEGASDGTKPRLAPTIAVNYPLKTNGLMTFVRVSYVVPPHGDR